MGVDLFLKGWATFLLGLVRPVFRRHWLRLVLGFVALITVDFLQLTIPRFVKTAVDALGAGTATQPLLLHVSGAICLVAVVVAVVLEALTQEPSSVLVVAVVVSTALVAVASRMVPTATTALLVLVASTQLLVRGVLVAMSVEAAELVLHGAMSAVLVALLATHFKTVALSPGPTTAMYVAEQHKG